MYPYRNRFFASFTSSDRGSQHKRVRERDGKKSARYLTSRFICYQWTCLFHLLSKTPNAWGNIREIKPSKAPWILEMCITWMNAVFLSLSHSFSYTHTHTDSEQTYIDRQPHSAFSLGRKNQATPQSPLPFEWTWKTELCYFACSALLSFPLPSHSMCLFYLCQNVRKICVCSMILEIQLLLLLLLRWCNEVFHVLSFSLFPSLCSI